MRKPQAARCSLTARLGHGRDQLQRVGGAVGFSLLEIAVDLAHRIRHVGEADDRLLLRAGEGVERGRFHLDGHDPLCPCGRDRRWGLAERGVRRPRRAAVGRDAGVKQRLLGPVDERRIGSGEGGRRKAEGNDSWCLHRAAPAL